MNLTPKQSRLLDYLKTWGTITDLQAREKLGDGRSSDTVLRLRAKGYRIHMNLFDSCNRYGESVRIGRYVFLGGPGETHRL